MEVSYLFATVHNWVKSLQLLLGVEAQVVFTIVPQGTESVNGSREDIGCTSPVYQNNETMICLSDNFLIDGCSPTIDTTTSHWASELVTVRRSESVPDLPFAHVLLAFGFAENVSLTGIEMDLFLCPNWGISASTITVYPFDDTNATAYISYPPANFMPEQFSCDSLSTITITGEVLTALSYSTIGIVVEMSPIPGIEWVHFGDIRFLGLNLAPSPSCVAPTTITPTSTLTSSSEHCYSNVM